MTSVIESNHDVDGAASDFSSSPRARVAVNHSALCTHVTDSHHNSSASWARHQWRVIFSSLFLNRHCVGDNAGRKRVCVVLC